MKKRQWIFSALSVRGGDGLGNPGPSGVSGFKGKSQSLLSVSTNLRTVVSTEGKSD